WRPYGDPDGCPDGDDSGPDGGPDSDGDPNGGTDGDSDPDGCPDGDDGDPNGGSYITTYRSARSSTNCGRCEMATTADVNPDDIIVSDIKQGSVVVDSRVYFPDTAATEADSFASTLLSNSSSIFTDKNFQAYGDITGDNIVVENITVVFTNAPSQHGVTPSPSEAVYTSAPSQHVVTPSPIAAEDDSSDGLPAWQIAIIVISCVVGVLGGIGAAGAVYAKISSNTQEDVEYGQPGNEHVAIKAPDSSLPSVTMNPIMADYRDNL
ncbi:hypothetical protein CYMTET_55924, partial [Cymbomonas tetramitiformis]